MLKQNYKEILKNPTWKMNVIKILKDIDKRLKQLEKGEIFNLMFSPINHNHDERYSSISHSHNDVYSQLGHIHEQYVTANDTVHNSMLFDGHNVDEFSKSNHMHPMACFICPFMVHDTSGTTTITLTQNCSPANTLFIDGDYFEVVAVNADKAIISYDVPEEEINKIFHMIYWVENEFVLKDTNINTQDVIGNIGEDVTLYSIINDENNIPVEEGNVTYEITDRGEE